MRQMRKRQPKFRVGDKVKNIWNENVYTVTSVIDTGYMLDDRYLPFDDEMCWVLADAPESRPEPTYKFRVGDRIMNVRGKDEHTVTSIKDNGYWTDDNRHISFFDERCWKRVEPKQQPEPTRKFNIGDIVQRGCIQYKIIGLDGDDYDAIDTVKLEHGLKSPFDITKIGIYDDECELVKKAESYVQQIVPKFKVGDKVKHKVVSLHNPATKYIYTVIEIENDKYWLDHNDHESQIPIGCQDEFELVNEPEPKLKLGVDLNKEPCIDTIWKDTLANLVGDITKRNADAFVWLIDETLKFMDCDAYVDDARAGMRQFVDELKKRLGYE